MKSNRRLFELCVRDEVVALKELYASSRHCLSSRHDVYHFNNSLLHVASQYGSLKCLDFLLEKAPFLCGSRNIVGNYPLNLACSSGNIECVRAMLCNNACQQSIDLLGQDHRAALHDAVVGNHVSIVQMLLDSGADPDVRNYKGQSPMHIIKSPECARVLYQASANLDATDKNGNTALHQFCSNDDSTLVGTLLSLEADPCLRNKLGRTPLHSACLYSSHTCIQLLLRRGCVDMLNDTDIHGWTALHLTVFKNDHAGSLALLKYGALPNIKDQIGRTPLYFACTFVPSRLLLAYLLLFEANVHDKAIDGQTPLHMACAEVDDNLAVLVLLENGANIIETDNSFNTPLHLAVKSKNLGTTAMLLQHLQQEGAIMRRYPRCCPCPRHVFYYTDIPLRPSAALITALYSCDGSGNTPLNICCSDQYEDDSYDICMLLLLYGVRDEANYISIKTTTQQYPFCWLNRTTSTRASTNHPMNNTPIERLQRFVNWKRQASALMVFGGSVKDPSRACIPLVFAINLLRALIISFI
jgi:ankyrin repeat protein